MSPSVECVQIDYNITCKLTKRHLCLTITFLLTSFPFGPICNCIHSYEMVTLKSNMVDFEDCLAYAVGKKIVVQFIFVRTRFQCSEHKVGAAILVLFLWVNYFSQIIIPGGYFSRNDRGVPSDTKCYRGQWGSWNWCVYGEFLTFSRNTKYWRAVHQTNRFFLQKWAITHDIVYEMDSLESS